MKIYENDQAEVHYGIFRGWRVKLKGIARTVSAPKTASQCLVVLTDKLQDRGYDFHAQEDVKAVVLDWLIEFCEGEPGGLAQRVMLQESPDKLVNEMVREIEHNRFVT